MLLGLLIAFAGAAMTCFTLAHLSVHARLLPFAALIAGVLLIRAGFHAIFMFLLQNEMFQMKKKTVHNEHPFT